MFNMKKLFLLAALATTAMTSCEKGADANGNEKEDAKMNVVISFPQAMGTRVNDSNASAKDVAIESVTVFVFDQNGKAETGNGTTFLQQDFNVVSGNKFELKPDKRILTTAGSRRIYVGINLPTALKGAADEKALIAKASIVGLEGANSVAMLSKVAARTLVSQKNDGDPTPANNVVSTEVERLVSKVAVIAGENATWPLNEENGGGTGNGNTFSVTPDKFSVGGLATTFYPVQRLSNGKLDTPGDKVDDGVAQFRDINPKGSTISALDAFYVYEHSDPKQTYLQKDLTFAVVRAEFTFAKFAKTGTGGIEYEDAATLASGASVYTFRVGNITYACRSEAIADQVKTALGVDLSTTPTDLYKADAAGKLYTYYHLFLNKDETDRLAVKRNQFFSINVSGVRGLGSSEDVPDPDEPVVEETNLEVITDVLAWDHKPIDQILGR
jgi:hypothetical protein